MELSSRSDRVSLEGRADRSHAHVNTRDGGAASPAGDPRHRGPASRIDEASKCSRSAGPRSLVSPLPNIFLKVDSPTCLGVEFRTAGHDFVVLQSYFERARAGSRFELGLEESDD